MILHFKNYLPWVMVIKSFLNKQIYLILVVIRYVVVNYLSSVVRKLVQMMTFEWSLCPFIKLLLFCRIYQLGSLFCLTAILVVLSHCSFRLVLRLDCFVYLICCLILDKKDFYRLCNCWRIAFVDSWMLVLLKKMKICLFSCSLLCMDLIFYLSYLLVKNKRYFEA